MNIVSDGRRVKADLYGNSGERILMIHGIPGSRRVWAPVAEKLARDFQVLCPDLIGFGESKRASGIDALWAPAQAQALLQLLDKLEWENISVVGHDFGGPVAIELYKIAGAKFRTLTLAATNMFPDTPIPFPLSGIFWPIIGPYWRKLLFSRVSLAMMVRSGMIATKPKDMSIYLGSKSQSTAIATIFDAALRELAKRYSPILSAWSEVKVPAQVIWGDKDPFFSVEVGERTASINGASFHLLAKTGHFIPEEQSDQMSELIKGFVLKNV